MTPQNSQGDERRSDGANLLHVIVWILLFPFLWIGVATNFRGLAEQLSFLPGISREGGVVSGIISIVLTAVVLGVVIGAITAAIGGGIPVIGGDSDTSPGPTNATRAPTPTPTVTPPQTRTDTPNETPTVTPTSESLRTSTPIVTPTPASELSDFKRFEENLRANLQNTVHNNTLTPVPVLSMEYRETDDGITELWVVYWECDTVEEGNNQRVNVAIEFANTAGHIEGEQPDRLRVYSVLSLETYPDSIARISTTSAESFYNRSIDFSKYMESWYQRLQEPTESQSKIAYQMVVNDSGSAKAERVFKEKYPLEESDRDCHGMSEDVNESANDQQVTNLGAALAAKPTTP